MADTLVDALEEAARAQGSPLTKEQTAEITAAFLAGDGGSPNAVTGSSDPTLVSVKQPMGLGPGGGYMPAMQFEEYEGNAKSLTDLNNSQSWLSRVMSSDEGYNSLVAALKGIGAISTDNPTWGTVAAAARAALSSAGSRSQEFWSFVNDRTVQDPVDDGPSGGGGGVGRAPRLPSRTEQVDLTNEGTATQVLNTAMLESVGREATSKEIAAFTQLLNSEETDNPLYRQDTPVGLADTNVERGGGINKELLAAEFADGTPGAKEYKMATEGMEAVEDWFAKKIGLF